MQIQFLGALCLSLLLYACGNRPADSTNSEPREGELTTSGEPMLEGGGEWTNLLPDGDLSAWHSYGKDAPGAAWKVGDDGSVTLDTTNRGEHGVEGGGDLITNESYDNYELELEWKISDCGNSGIIYNVTEADDLDNTYLSGPEMQIVDNACHPDAKIPKHRAGDLYDMKSSAVETSKPAGEWNQVRLLVSDGKVEQWQNGELVVSYTNSGPEWNAMIADSKFKDFGQFGKTTSGKISLQDHGNAVSFRNIRIRELDSK